MTTSPVTNSNIKPLFCKYAHAQHPKSLSILTKRNEKLQNLTIQADLWRSIMKEPRTLENMKKVLITSKILRKFRIDAEKFEARPLRKMPTELTGYGIVRLVESLKNHSALANVEFCMGEMGGDVGEFLSILARHLSYALAKLRDFSFGAIFYLKGESGRARLKKRGLRHIPFLQGISLKFPWKYGNLEDPLSNWSNSLFGYKNLKSLSLNLLGCFGQNDALKKLASNLKRFTCLENLSIILNSFDLTILQGGFGRLFEAVSQMVSLQSIRLSFSQCLNFTDDCLESLGGSLVNISNLKKLDLNFEMCLKISNEGVEYLSKGLERLEFLTEIKLDFLACPEINSKGLKQLVETLKNLKSLREAHLILENCDLIEIENLKKDFKGTPLSLSVVSQTQRGEMVVLVTNKKLIYGKQEED